MQSQPTFAKAGVAAGAVGVAAAVLFQEAGTVLELAAITAAGAFALPRFLSSPSAGVGEGTQKQQVKCALNIVTLTGLVLTPL